MRKWLQNRINFIKYGDLQEEVFENIKPDIARANLEMLTRASFWGMLIGILLLPVSYAVPSIAHNRYLYLVVILLMGSLYTGCKFMAGKNWDGLILLLSYLFLAMAFGIGLVMGTFLLRDSTATTICVLIFALPLLLIDVPGRMDLMILLSGAVFCVCSTKLKVPAISSVDVVNGVCFSLLSIFVNHAVLRIKFRDLANTRLISAERDTDGLTRLYNRSATETCIEQFIATRRALSALLVIDVDDFKSINDTNGHQWGDRALIEVAKSIRGVFRHGDVIGRFGGDEFIVFLPNVGNVHKTKEKVESLQKKLSENCIKDQLGTITLSIGVAHFPMDALTYKELFQCADRAVYQSKERGKNCYTVYGEEEKEL